MRRALAALAGTAAGTTLLLGLRAGFATGHGTDPSGADDPPASGPASGPASAAPPPGPVRSPGGAPATPGRPPAPSPGGGLRAGSFSGPTAQTRYGPVQVRITVAGGRITDVTALQLPESHGESVRINKRAGPVLRQEALTAQSAAIDTVSGATYTSQGYRTSLQGALATARA